MDILLAAILGFLTSFLAFKKNDKKNQLKYITQERKEWRQKIRKLSVEFINDDKDDKDDKLDTLLKHRTEIAINLNPYDKKDKYIIKLMDNYINSDEVNKTKLKKKLTKEFSRLLKHDWDRVKQETKSTSIFSFPKIIFFTILAYFLVDFIISFDWNPMSCFRCNYSIVYYFFIKILVSIIVYYFFQLIWKLFISNIEKEFESPNFFTKYIGAIIRKSGLIDKNQKK